MTDNQATGDEGAKHFLKANEDVWTKWVPADVASESQSRSLSAQRNEAASTPMLRRGAL